MRKLSLTFYFVLLSLFLGAQNSTSKLEGLQQALDAIQYGIGDGDTVRYRKIDVELDILKKRNDSLIFQHDLLTLEVLLLQAKLSACEDNRNSLENVLESERAVSFTKISIDNDNKLSESNLKKGSYIVLGAFRTYAKAKKQLDKVAKENEDLELIVAQNRRKTWFHVCIDDPFTKEESGQKVLKIRKKGYKDAWAIILN
jgi:hypothetical protein